MRLCLYFLLLAACFSISYTAVPEQITALTGMTATLPCPHKTGKPPKTKSKKVVKGKSSAVVDGLSTDEMSKDQLEEHIIRLREELDREREERSYFQLERDKIQAFWEISKRSLEETNAELRNRRREREEAEERHRVEITIDGVSSSGLTRLQNAEKELG
ncbi:hypothetical protein F7725_006016 [Dissostichus mawsoni]|uniref:Growth arrest-specific protein 8 n=1 Tax=Dissostichus mawsoni TaxID=36200 RepID=A0A7J5YV05_DISMA|nr:hypothetical protein F7725_006016 [Dissostichus mawsoni]